MPLTLVRATTNRVLWDTCADRFLTEAGDQPRALGPRLAPLAHQPQPLRRSPSWTSSSSGSFAGGPAEPGVPRRSGSSEKNEIGGAGLGVDMETEK